MSVRCVLLLYLSRYSILKQPSLYYSLQRVTKTAAMSRNPAYQCNSTPHLSSCYVLLAYLWQASFCAVWSTTFHPTSMLSFFLRPVLLPVGSLAVKYGSLVIDLPFQPNAALALSLIVLPTLAFSGIVAARSIQDTRKAGPESCK